MPKDASKVLRILVYGDNASFRMGGEATKPIRFFRGYLARGHECNLVTHERCRDELHEIMSDAELEKVTFLKDTRAQGFIYFLEKRLSLPIGSAIPLLSQRRLQKMLIRGDFGAIDVLHQTTPISPLAPSALSFRKCSVVHGPLAALPNYPADFFKPGQRQTFKDSVRLGLSRFLNRMWPARRSFDITYCDNEATVEIVKSVLGPETETRIELNNAAEPHWFSAKRTPPVSKPRFLFVGRLVDWKCVDVLIDAADLFGDPLDLIIVGDGPERARLEARCRQNPNISAEFKGWLGPAEITNEYATATAAISLALKESGGTSVIEAMASGVPLIASRWGGHTSRLRDGMGLLVEPGPRDQMVQQTCQHMQTLYRDPNLAAALGAAAQDHAKEKMLWTKKIETFERDIFDLLNRSGR